MILMSPTRSLPSPRPIDTDPILNYRHIQPAAAAAAVGPWLCQHQQQHYSPPSSPTNNHHHHHNIDIDNSNSNHNNSNSNPNHHFILTDSKSNTFLHSPFNPHQLPPQQQQQPFTPSCPSPKQLAPLLVSTHSPSSEISPSPTPSTFSLPPSAHTTTTTTNHNHNSNSNSNGNTTITRSPLSASTIPSANCSPTAIVMLPQSNSDEESTPAEEEHKPSIKPCHLSSLSTSANHSNNNHAAAPHQLDSHAASVSLYDLPPASSSAPTTSSSSSPFPSTNNNSSIPQQASYSSSPHPNHEHHSNPHPHHHQQQQQQHQHHHPEPQFYQPSPPALHSPLQSTHLHHNQQQQQQHPFDQRPPSGLYSLHHQPYPLCSQSAPPSASSIPMDPQSIAVAASNVEVKKWDEENTFYYQVAYKGVTVGRLKGSGLVNGTKLLNLAGISRGKRDGILKNEKIRKVVKHGTMHLKGVWIAFDRAVFLAEQHHIADKIFPLLEANLEHYVPIEQPMMAGGSKLGGLGYHHHHHHARHSRLLPQPIKFPHPALSLGPASANSFSSTGGWPSAPSSSTLLSIGFNEPFSAPPIPRTGETSQSIYEQAQFQYLNSAHSSNPDLLERRHTIPNNSTFHGYNSVSSFGSSQQQQQQQPNTHTLTYPFAYNPAQLSAYPPCSSTSESTPPTAFEYSPKNSLSGNGPNSPCSKN